jgi:hypothetical protein
MFGFFSVFSRVTFLSEIYAGQFQGNERNHLAEDNQQTRCQHNILYNYITLQIFIQLRGSNPCFNLMHPTDGTAYNLL